MNILVYPIQSLLRHDSIVSKESEILLKMLEERTGHTFSLITDINELKKSQLPLILVQSGGSEGKFKSEIYPYFKGPFYLLTYGASNSLAASLEILTFIHENNYKGEILHGDNDYIVSRIKKLLQERELEGLNKENKLHRLGVMGKPSDWLISSNVDYKQAKEVFDIDLIDIEEDEVIKTIERYYQKEDIQLPYKVQFDKKELKRAYQICLALDELVEKYQLEGFTLRCFDIITALKMSACLGLAYENNKDIIATCEGDVPAMITAYSIYKVLKVHAFQANPQWINPKENTIELAHCTFPLDMAKSYKFDTHFESSIGVAIHGEMKEGDCTIVKVSADLKEFYCQEGKILNNDYRGDRCRTQVKILLESPVTYFLKSSLGNHHQIIYGHHRKELKDYFESLGLREVI